MKNNITDEKCQGLSDEVYKISEGEIIEGELTSDSEFRVLAVEDNKNNGMQAMAVVPVDREEEIEVLQKLNNRIKRV